MFKTIKDVAVNNIKFCSTTLLLVIYSQQMFSEYFSLYKNVGFYA